jgi:leucyl aminopeptidase
MRFLSNHEGVIMEIDVIKADVTKSQSNVIVLPYYEGEKTLIGTAAIIDKSLDGILTQLISRGEIKGKFKEITSIFTLGKIPSPKVVVLGIGKKSDLNTEKIRVSIAEVCKSLKRSKSDVVDFVSFDMTNSEINGFDLSQSIAEGALLGTYNYNKHKKKDADNGNNIQIFNIIVLDAKSIDSYKDGVNKGSILAEASNLTRDMVNEPANYMTPAAIADIANLISQKYGLKIEVFGRNNIREFGMGGLLGVSQGSQEEPKFIVLDYNGNNSADIEVALVGKGITFDSGGISIKPSESMGDMKGDMAGGASVISAMGAIAQLKPKIHVIGIIPAAENMPSGTAMRPGDIIKIMNGKSVEIITTDAEGRLLLADGISYAKKLGAKKIVDIATLTGACRVALGDICVGAFSNNQELVNILISAAKGAGECIWQMPMNDEYRELNKSDVADLKNSGGRYGGAISAAWFLGEFAEGTPWVHLDIAGTAISEKDRGYLIKGATGIPVRTLVNLVISLAKE